MAKRQILLEEDFLDLVRNMTRADPAKRATLEQVMAHSYMQKDTASADEIRDHFYATMPKTKELNEEHYKAMQVARSSWAQTGQISRGAQDEAEMSFNVPEEEEDMWESL